MICLTILVCMLKLFIVVLRGVAVCKSGSVKVMFTVEESVLKKAIVFECADFYLLKTPETKRVDRE